MGYTHVTRRLTGKDLVLDHTVSPPAAAHLGADLPVHECHDRLGRDLVGARLEGFNGLVSVVLKDLYMDVKNGDTVGA